jgi:hypothetical protein
MPGNGAQFIQRASPAGSFVIGWRLAGAVWLTIQAGCASETPIFFSHSAASEGLPSPSCALEKIEARKELPRSGGIEGTATPFVIDKASFQDGDRRVRSGDLVAFSLNAGAAGPSPLHSSRVLALDPSGVALPPLTPLSDGSLVVWDDESAAGTPGITRESSAGAVFILVKADVPDRTRPTTCDDQIRAGDFVFLRTPNPSAWVTATAAGVPDIQHRLLARQSTPSGGAGNPACASDHETCRTDAGGGLVCVWAPSCAN